MLTHNIRGKAARSVAPSPSSWVSRGLIVLAEVDLQGITGEGITLPRFTVEIPQDMLMKIGRLIALQKGMMPDNAVDIFPVAMKFVTGET